MSAGSEEGLNRRPLVGLSVNISAMSLLKVLDSFPEGENNEADFVFELRTFCADLDLRLSSGLGSKRKWQKLSYGAAMPLGELQEDMHMGEGLPIGPERELSRAVVRSIR